MKKILALVLAFAIPACTLLGCRRSDNAGGNAYTYNSYTAALATNWNPHTWEMNADQGILNYLSTPLADMTVKDSKTGEYQWIFVAATDIQDVTAEHQGDLEKYQVILPAGKTPSDMQKDYVFEIKLRPEMKWENGDPITADDYIYSMQQLLDPKMQNYRANTFWSGDGALAGAYNYYNSGMPIYGPVVPPYGEQDTPDYAMDITSRPVYLHLTSGEMTVAGYSFYDFAKGDYAGYVSGEIYDKLASQADPLGYIHVTNANKADVLAAMDGFLKAFGASIYQVDGAVNADLFKEFLFYNTGKVSDVYSWDTVGLYKVDDYTIRYVCETAYDYYYFLTSMTSNWLVHKPTYERLKDNSGTFITTTYNTSKDTTMSYGAYRLESMQDDKQMVLVQNEHYWEFDKNPDGSLTSTTFFQVDGAYQPQFQTQKIVIDVLTNDAAKLAFLSGKLDEWTPAADEVVEYTTSEQLYQVDETYTMRFFFHTNLSTLKKLDQKNNQNSVVLSNADFRKAMSLALDREEWVTATEGYKPAYSMINSLYYYDVYQDPASVYRNTKEAMEAICRVYGVTWGEGSPYATLEEAYRSINGFNLTEAKALFTKACQQLVANGLYKKGEDIVIEIAYSAGSMDSSKQQQIVLFNQQLNRALEGTGFGKIQLKAVDNLANRYKAVAQGQYAIGYGAWGGAAFYPFTIFQVYCDPNYADPIHEIGCWDPTQEELTLTVEGQSVTMTWQEWSGAMSGTGRFADASNDVKLQILSALEAHYLEKYYVIPLASTCACSMLSYKVSYYTENYSIMYGFGGMRLLRHNYTDSAWADFVASQGGQLTY